MANVQYQAGLRFGHALAIQQVRDVVDKLFHPDIINSLAIVLDRISMPPFPFEFSSPRAARATTSGPASGALHPPEGLLAIPPMPMYIEASPSPPHPAPEPYLPASPTHHHHTSGSLHSTANCLPDSSNREDSEEPALAPPARRRGRTASDVPAALVKEEQEYTAPVQPLQRGVRATRSRVSYAENSLDAAELEDAHEASVPRPGQRRNALYFGTPIDSDSEDAAPAQSACKRGRPRKLVVSDLKQEEEEEVPAPRRRLSTTASSTKAMVEEDLSAVQAPKKRGQGGRPRKNVVPTETLVVSDLRQEGEEEEEEEEEAPAPKRGRLSSTTAGKGQTPVLAPRKRGRPAKKLPSQAGWSVLVPFDGKLIDQEVKRGNGRKRKVVASDTDTRTAEAYRAASKFEEDWEW